MAAAARHSNRVPGSPDLYISTMQQLLPAIQHPTYESALLMRLLAEEGVVGSRSVSGREGPVVGRPVRHSGSRPLLVQEILEHWESEIKPTCLLRWCRQAATSPEQLEQQLHEACIKAQDTLHWQVLDSQYVCHGSSSSRGSPETTDSPSSSSSSSSSGGGGSSSSSSGSGGGSSSCSRNPTCAVATATLPAAAAGVMIPPCNMSVIVQPYTSVVQAICSCQAPVVIASTYPIDITHAALRAAGLQLQEMSSARVIQGASLAQCAQQLLQHQEQQQQRQQWQQQGQRSPAMKQQQQQLLDAGTDGQQQSSMGVTFVLSSPSKAHLVHTSIAQQHTGQAAAAAGLVWGDNVSMLQPKQQQPVSLQVGEWCCSAPSLRAKALAGPAMGLLSECGLAGLLGVSHCDAVMDGIAWRQ